MNDYEVLEIWRSVAQLIGERDDAAVEHEPHFRTIRWIRTTRGATPRRRAQWSTRFRNRLRRSIALFGGIEQQHENAIDDPAPLGRAEDE